MSQFRTDEPTPEDITSFDPDKLGYAFERPHVDQDTGEEIPASVVVAFHYVSCDNHENGHAVGIRLAGLDRVARHVAAIEWLAKHSFGEFAYQANFERATAELHDKKGRP